MSEFKKFAFENRWNALALLIFLVVAGIVTWVCVCLSLFNDNWNYALLFFAVFGGGLAVWGRINTERQLRYTQQQMEATERQIELTRLSNNNQVFLEATRMLQGKIEKDNNIRHVAGLQMIIKLARDDPENEYIRCVEFICSWLRKNYPASHETEVTMHDEKVRASVGLRMPEEIRNLIGDFFASKLHEAERVVEDYMEKRHYRLWPHLEKINFTSLYSKNANLPRVSLKEAKLEEAYLEEANLSEACFLDANLKETILKDANLKDADLTGANLEEAMQITPDQILSAKWYNYAGEGEPPKLPVELKNNPKIKKWLSKHHGEFYSNP